MESSDYILDHPTDTKEIDNLEYFPMEVLLKIFARTDDIGLMYLAEVSNRFATIAPIVFGNRYQNQYFAINGEHRGGDPELYCDLLNRFGSCIKAFVISHIRAIDDDLWMVKILQQHIHRIEKLTLIACDFTSNIILVQAVNVTDLVFRNVRFYDSTDLPDCHNLQKLEIRNTQNISINSLKQTIRNNSNLQSLSLRNNTFAGSFRTAIEPVDEFIANHLNHIKELAFVENGFSFSANYGRLPDTITKMVNSFKYLESLALIDVNEDSIGMVELLQRIGMECVKIKRLELHVFIRLDQFMETIRSFQRVESLHLSLDTLYVTSLIKHMPYLPNLRHLYLCVTGDYIHSNVLPLLRECHSLEIITIDFEGKWPNISKYFMNVRFFDEFIETITITDKPNARIEIFGKSPVFGFITGNGIVWRNKLIHWMGCDKNHSSSNVQLLDLAKQPGKKSDGPEKNLLDRIFDYLDIYSLYSIGETSTQSKQLVEKYIEKHSHWRGAFTITDEFVEDIKVQRYTSARYITNLRIHRQGAFVEDIKVQQYSFAQYVTNLHIYPIYSMDRIVKLIHGYKHLDKVTIHNYYTTKYWHSTLPILQQVRHVIIDTFSFVDCLELNRIFQLTPNIEIIELKRASLFGDFKFAPRGRPNNLKKFIFSYRGKTQMKNLEFFFEYTNTQLAPIF